MVTANFRITKPSSHYEGNPEGTDYWEKKTEPDVVTREHEKNLHKKQKLLELVRSLDSRGYSQVEIGAELGISRTTVWRYLKSSFDAGSAHYDQKHGGKLKPYEDTIKGMLGQKHTFKEIEQRLREEGYDGAASTIRMYATRERKLLQHAKCGDKGKTELIERKWLIKLLYQPLDQIRGITEEQLNQIIQEYPMIGKLYDLMGSFKEILFAQKPEDMQEWITEALAVKSEEIRGFANGIMRDMEAVKNAIRYEYNNGLAEGSVNKLKVTKRIMYGRCSFDTLKKKLLLREKYRHPQQT